MEYYLNEARYELCDMCLKPLDDCICPICPHCESVGEPTCYLPSPYGHALPYGSRQLNSFNFERVRMADEQAKEDRFWDDEFILDAFNNHIYNEEGKYAPWQYISYTNEAHRDCLLSIAIAMRAAAIE